MAVVAVFVAVVFRFRHFSIGEQRVLLRAHQLICYLQIAKFANSVSKS